ncbi:hypothetical protein QEG73_14975 [Chitinophagaceae bacterium 26-R-25]|nr:hypothetical protein [Chitinophagaceae bacterium 26-R-25]
MNNKLKYMPVLRVRQEEIKVLKSFDFGKSIYPCLEIYKEKDQQRSKKSFTQIHIELINKIKADKVFVDLPVHLKLSRKMKISVITFLRTVISNRQERTAHLIKLAPLSKKIIPVVSSYFLKTGEPSSIKLQENDLRKYFDQIAFRTFPDSFNNDFLQILSVAHSQDFLIVDLGNVLPDKQDETFREILAKLNSFDKCKIIILRSSINKISNVELDHGKEVSTIDNSLVDLYQDYSGSAFGDYGGIKKDDLTEGGIISPGFLYYDAINNTFFGFKGKVKELDEFENTIVPSVISSDSTSRMKDSPVGYLNSDNLGWRLITAINDGLENGRSMAKFKKIALLHYLHCIRKKIDSGGFNIFN